MLNIGVIGSGPAGMMAALYAAMNGARVTIIDSNHQVGRKLLVTGAGRCNLTNADTAAVRYACENPVWLNSVLIRYPREQLLGFLESIGVPAYSTWDGWYYPVSESAQAVADAFYAELENKKVTKRLARLVTGIEAVDGGFDIFFHREKAHFDRVVVASGGKAYPSLGSDGSLYSVLRAFGHKIHPVYPALAPVTAEMSNLQELQGIRLDANITLKQDGNAIGVTFGNFIFTRWGVNGPGVMDLSYLVNIYSAEKMTLEFNFLHRYEKQVLGLLSASGGIDLPVLVALQSVIPPKLARFLLDSLSLDIWQKCSTIAKKTRLELIRLLTRFELQVTGTRGYEYCQVSAGGVSVEEVNPDTMESLRIPGLYFAGEVLDVIGPCGGYNLHFAFTSGAVAGMASAAGAVSGPAPD